MLSKQSTVDDQRRQAVAAGLKLKSGIKEAKAA